MLVVEDEKFHVHRQILSIHSPVFKAMLGTNFKEATAKEIPLIGKKVNEILDFLKQLYLKESDGVTCKGKISSFEYNLGLFSPQIMIKNLTTILLNFYEKALKAMETTEINID